MRGASGGVLDVAGTVAFTASTALATEGLDLPRRVGDVRVIVVVLDLILACLRTGGLMVRALVRAAAMTFLTECLLFRRGQSHASSNRLLACLRTLGCIVVAVVRAAIRTLVTELPFPLRRERVGWGISDLRLAG